MALMKQLWTINALYTEFNIDRRTLAKRLAFVQPAQVKGRSSLYLLSEVVNHLTARLDGTRNGGHVEEIPWAQLSDAEKDNVARFVVQIYDKLAGPAALGLRQEVKLSVPNAWRTLVMLWQLLEWAIKDLLILPDDYSLATPSMIDRLSEKRGRLELFNWLESKAPGQPQSGRGHVR